MKKGGKAELAYRLWQLGLSKWQIAKELYNCRTREECCKTELKVHGLIQYYMRRQRKQYDNENNMQGDELEIDYSGGIRNVDEHYSFEQLDDYTKEYEEENEVRHALGLRPISYSRYVALYKSSLPKQKQIEKDLEQVLWHYHQQLNIAEPLRSSTWGMVKYVNKHLAKYFSSRAGNASKPYPKLLAYVFVCYFIALHRSYPHIVFSVQRLIERHLTVRNRKRYEHYVNVFLQHCAPLLLQQYM